VTHLTHCLELDHQRLDAVLAEAKGLATKGALHDAQDRFDIFAAGLSRHIDAEETILFPALGDAAEGPVRVMCTEHHRLRELLGAIRSALANDQSTWTEPFGALEALLGQHNAKEERVLYPLSNDVTKGRTDLTALCTTLGAAIESPVVER